MSLFNSKSPPAQNNATQAPSSLVPFTEDDVKQALPNHLRSAVTPQLVNNLNQVSNDPITAENIRNNFISYAGVMREGRFKTEDYLNAVAYVSYKLMGYTNEDSYMRTFPQRYQALIAKGTQKKDIAAYVAAYNKGKLVNLILEQTLVPSWVLNQDVYQKAINVQLELMQNAQSEKVRSDAANSILTHLAKPKDSNIQINIGETENAGMRELRDMMTQLAQNQKKAIEDGAMKTIDIAAQRITKTE